MELKMEGLAGGGLMERLRDAITQALENIADPNTDAKKPRKVKCDLTIKSNEQRNMAVVSVNVSTLLAAPAPIETSVLFGVDRHGEMQAAELDHNNQYGTAPLPVEIEMADERVVNIAGGK